jgi:hypothetical protein
MCWRKKYQDRVGEIISAEGLPGLEKRNFYCWMTEGNELIFRNLSRFRKDNFKKVKIRAVCKKGGMKTIDL